MGGITFVIFFIFLLCSSIGSHIISDSWPAYLAGIPELRDSSGRPLYTHSTVNHSKHFVNPQDGSHTNTIEGTWDVAKAANRRRWGTHRSMIDSYLCEFLWRRRLQGRDPFEAILKDIADLNPIRE